MKEYTNQIILWYRENKRDLPWRQDRDPYHVWVSEIMLQQTRIEAVIAYYHRFIKELPTIKSLANVSEEKLLKLWEGLGYYSRARNLKKAAQTIIQEYQGKFPTTYVDIIKLPGIGEYTASALASICFQEPEVTIDGNVLRVFTRFHNDTRNIDLNQTKKDIRNHLMNIIPKESGEFNQGLMEIGETICIPNGIPKCEICPLKKGCLAYHQNTYSFLPKRKEKTSKKEEKYTILLLQYQNKYAIYQRTNETLLKNLYAFPQIPEFLSLKELKEVLQENKLEEQTIQTGPNYTHIFTHKKWNMISYIIPLRQESYKYQFYSLEEIEQYYAMASAYKPFLQFLQNLTK